MANLTLTIDAEVLRRARIRALERGTSVNAVVRDYLGRFARADDPGAALREFARLAKAGGSGSGPGGRRWTREELYDR